MIIKISKETLKALRDRLHHGNITDIAKRAGYSREYVSLLLGGNANINEDNICIIHEAQRMIREQNSEAKKIEDQINKTLNQ